MKSYLIEAITDSGVSERESRCRGRDIQVEMTLGQSDSHYKGKYKAP